MMLRTLFLIGILLFTRPAYAQEQEEEPDTLYKRIRAAVERETDLSKTELATQRFAAGAYYHHPIESSTKTETGQESYGTFVVNEKEVADAVKKDVMSLCGNDHHRMEACGRAQGTLEVLVERAAWVRGLGRRLQAVASGYEGAMYGYPGSPIDIAIRLSSIGAIWRAGNDPFIQPIVESFLRAAPLPDRDFTENEVKELIGKMEDKLVRKKDGPNGEKKKDDTEFVAAVWRYRNGVKYVQNREGTCNPQALAQNPERTYQERRYCDPDTVDVEAELLAILAPVQSWVQNSLEPKKQTHEQIIFPSIVDKKKNITVWIRDDDIGLQWYIATEPVQPALFIPPFIDCIEGGTATKDCSEMFENAIIRGGNYPEPVPQDGSGSRVPEPKNGEGLCSHPFARRGYLCRSVESENCGLIAEDSKKIDDDDIKDIVLAGCEPERFRNEVSRRLSGSDVCGIGGWRSTVDENTVKDTPEWQDDMKPNKCSPCAIDVKCDTACDGETDMAFTKLARNKGVVRICMPASFDATGNLEYLLAHEMVHAQQICQMSELQSYERFGIFEKDSNGDGQMDAEEAKKAAAACCATERESYFAQCKMMAMDGILDLAGIGIDQCASVYANFSCAQYVPPNATGNDVYPCSTDGINPVDMRKKLDKVVLDNKDRLKLPSKCADLINAPTARIKAIYDSLPLTCAAGCQSRYANTIGNNLCYTAQCVEQTYEFQRPIPGRTTLTTTDQSFPWDSCELPDPQIAAVADPPAFTGPKLPPYRPAELLQALDMALCQLNGLPARTPPVICGFDGNRRISLPLQRGIESVTSLTMQPAEYAAAHFGLEEAAGSIGAMRVSDMFALYLTPAARQFGDILNVAKSTLATIGSTKFPSTMCPRQADRNVCNLLKQQ